MFFEKLAQENKYDKYLLQQVWDETNSLVQMALSSFEKKYYPQLLKIKDNDILCNYQYSKGENRGHKCGHKVVGPNRTTCYRHTPELHTFPTQNFLISIVETPIVDSNIENGKKCIHVPNKGKFANTKCGNKVQGETDFCKKHTIT